MANKLINETSPYLLQHAHNPVDWYPWGKEALDTALERDKPIFLSIGYSACHWCHVMEKESFENSDISTVMNDNFVNIKVDREERPEIDHIYMMAIQSMIGHGGWPLSVFLTPHCEPFYGGTYFPPYARHGMSGFKEVLEAVSDAYKNRRPEIINSVDQITNILQANNQSRRDGSQVNPDKLKETVDILKSDFDDKYGGFGVAPKFPQPMTLDVLLRDYFRTADENSLAMLELTLMKMANGGIYDQLGGGFHRYSTDPFWLVPHFEKMLYDNALLSDLYSDVYKITKNPFYSDIVQQTLDYVLREMTSPIGGFYSAQDADSEGEEGKFFVWTSVEMDRILGADCSNIIKTYYGVTHEGNFDDRNILFKPRSDKEVSDSLGISLTEMQKTLQESKYKLKAVRDNRIPPNTDTKVLTAWNGLMIKSLSKASVLFDRPDYLNAAIKNAHFILDNMNQGNRLLRTYKDGNAKLLGYLEDYGCFINGLMCLYEATLDIYWLNMSEKLSDKMIDLFWDDAENMFYDIGHDHEDLLVRPRDVGDGAMPCGGSMASYVLLRLSIFTGDDKYWHKSMMNIESVGNYIFRAPHGAGNWLASVDFILGDRVEVALIGQLDSQETHRLLATVNSFYLPNMILVAQNPDSMITSIHIPALEHKLTVDGKSTVFLCRGYVCQQPVTDVEELISQLENRTWVI